MNLLTADDVLNVKFQVSSFKEGYNQDEVDVAQAPAVEAQRAHPAAFETDPLSVDSAQVQLVDPGGPDEEVAHSGSGEVREAQAAVLNEERLDIGVVELPGPDTGVDQLHRAPGGARTVKVGGAQALQAAVDQPRRGQIGVVSENLREPAAEQRERRQVAAAEVRLDQLQVLDHLAGGELIGLAVAQATEVRCREDRWPRGGRGGGACGRVDPS